MKDKIQWVEKDEVKEVGSHSNMLRLQHITTKERKEAKKARQREATKAAKEVMENGEKVMKDENTRRMTKLKWTFTYTQGFPRWGVGSVTRP